MATWCEELIHWKRPWCWERLKAGGEGDNQGWDGWMASLTWWTWVWVSSRSWHWTWKPGMLQSTGYHRVKHDWATEVNWTDMIFYIYLVFCGFDRLTFVLIDFRRLVWIFCVSNHINEGEKFNIFPVYMLFFLFLDLFYTDYRLNIGCVSEHPCLFSIAKGNVLFFTIKCGIIL